MVHLFFTDVCQLIDHLPIPAGINVTIGHHIISYSIFLFSVEPKYYFFPRHTFLLSFTCWYLVREELKWITHFTLDCNHRPAQSVDGGFDKCIPPVKVRSAELNLRCPNRWSNTKYFNLKICKSTWRKLKTLIMDGTNLWTDAYKVKNTNVEV